MIAKQFVAIFVFHYNKKVEQCMTDRKSSNQNEQRSKDKSLKAKLSETSNDMRNENLNKVNAALVEQGLNEIQEFISLMCGSSLRFYSTLLLQSELEEMWEDLIEIITTMIFHQPNLTQLVVQLCKMGTEDE